MVSVTRRAALVVAAAAFAAPLLGTVPALAAEPAPGAGQPEQGQLPGDLIFVEVTPSTVQPGYLVGIRASCRDNSIPAIVVSDAFGRVQVQPQRGLLTASPMVRERTRPGNYRVKLECPGGQTASTMLQVIKRVPPTPAPTTHAPPTRVPPSHGPATGFGGTADGLGPGGLLVPGGLALTLAGAVVGLMAVRRPGAARGAARR